MNSIELYLTVVAISSTATLAAGKFFRFMRSEMDEAKPKKWEPFEPMDCDELPLHDWSYTFRQSMGEGAFVCPKCNSFNRGQPPYCPERGGHYHFKCVAIGASNNGGCGYEWAMRPADYKPDTGTPTTEASSPWPKPHVRPIPDSGVS
jgi:hypothetical protein